MMVHSVKITDAIPVIEKSAVVAANVDAVVTITPAATEFVVVWWVLAGYSAAPTSTTASLKSTGLIGGAADATKNLDYDLVGTMPLLVPGPLYAAVGQEVVFTLEAGGVSSVGNVNVLYAKIPA